MTIEGEIARTLPSIAGSPHLTVSKVEKQFPSLGKNPPVHAMGPLDLELRQGEFFALVGPSGCGKSTLLDIIAGLAKPSVGEITFEGQRILGTPPAGMGVVLQEDASYPWLSVWDNVAFGLRRTRTSKDEIAHRVNDALAFLGLSDFARAYPAQLSGGMRQRVCIGRTLVLQPRMILLDEPFGALDQQTRLLMGDELMRLWRRTGATIFLITHSLDEAAVLADRVGVMSARPGKIIEVMKTGWSKERTSELYTHPDFGAITGHLWALLRTESLRAARQAEAKR